MKNETKKIRDMLISLKGGPNAPSVPGLAHPVYGVFDAILSEIDKLNDRVHKLEGGK
jgi:hypothetical protein